MKYYEELVKQGSDLEPPELAVFDTPTSDFTGIEARREALAPFFSFPPYESRDKLFHLQPMISPHENAPLFNGPDADKILGEVLSEVLGGNFPDDERFLDVFRQAATVSLWFFLKAVASHSAAYDKINNELHLEIANFRQLCLEPGGYYAVFTPRASYKTSIVDTGATPWEFVRDPELTIGIFSATGDKSQQFYMQAKSIMDSNKIFKALWPEFVPKDKTHRGNEWNDSYLNLPNRRIRKATPSLMAYTASGSVSGTHIALSIIDDIVSDAMLNASRGATAELIEKRNWFETNVHSLREEPETSRTIVAGTRYSIEDPYENIQKDSVEHYGDWTILGNRYPVKTDGIWKTYYRSAKVQIGTEEFSIQPKAYSLKFLNKLAETDPWTYHYQYENNAIGVSGAQFGEYSPAECIFGDEGIEIENTGEFISYSECDITVVIDPAGRSTRASIRTSQTAMVVLCQDKHGRKFIDGKKGYVKTTDWFNWIFSKAAFFGDDLKRTIVEEVAGFKSLDSVILREQYTRGIRLKYRAIPSLGEKISTIQTLVQPELNAGTLYINKRVRGQLMDEMKVFPNGTAMDFLDALKIGIKVSKKPEAEYEKNSRAEREIEAFAGVNNNTAY